MARQTSLLPNRSTTPSTPTFAPDIYSLGCTLYYLLSGGPPFQAKTLYDILQAHHSMDALMLNFVRPEVPTELASVVAKMMAKEPDWRFQAPGEVAKAVAPFFKRAAQVGVTSDIRTPPETAPAAARSRAGSAQVATDSSSAAPPAATPLAARNQDRPEEMWKSLIDFTEPEEIPSPPAIAIRDRARTSALVLARPGQSGGIRRDPVRCWNHIPNRHRQRAARYRGRRSEHRGGR